MLRDRVPLAMNRAGAAESNVIGLGQWIDALNSNPFGANAAEGKWRRWKRPSFAPLDSTFNSMGWDKLHAIHEPIHQDQVNYF